MPRYKWPESVPVLTATDIGYGDCRLPRRTLWDWIRLCFHDLPPHKVFAALYREVDNIEHCAIIDLEQMPRTRRDGHGKAVTKSDIADIWNAAMRSLGYTEIEEVDCEDM